MDFKDILPDDSRVRLTLDFTGHYNEEHYGIFRHSYSDENGRQAWLVSTTFEPSNARIAFPCFDEPAFKATFILQLVLSGNESAVSTMPVESTTVNGDRTRTVTFEKSPPMSTYSLGFAVGSFVFSEVVVNNITVRIHTASQKQQRAVGFALDQLSGALSVMQGYFRQAYPLPKLDLVALPKLSVGTEENWGMITMRESVVLIDPDFYCYTDLQRVATSIAHAVAHQWLGDSVTCEWWTDLWYFEALCTYLEYFTVNALHPQWKIWEQFVVDEEMLTLRADALAGSHPLMETIVDPSQVTNYDDLEWAKGAALMRMLARRLDQTGDSTQEGVFQRVLFLFVRRFKLGVASTTDFWNLVQEVSGLDAHNYLTTWAEMPGYPLVEVEVVAGTPQNPETVKFRQYREFLLPDEIVEQRGTNLEAYQWWIPIDVMTEHGSYHYFELTNNSLIVNAQTAGLSHGWWKANWGQFGMYRLLYPAEMFNHLDDHFEILPSIDRAGLIDDSFSLSYNGHLDATIGLKLIDSMAVEKSYTVWKTFRHHIQWVNILLAQSHCYDLFLEFVRDSVSPLVHSYGWSFQVSETDLDVLVRRQVTEIAVEYDDPDTVQASLSKYKHLRALSGGYVPSDFRYSIYRAATGTNLTDEDFDFILRRLQSTNAQFETDDLLQALSGIQNATLMDRLMEFAFSGSLSPSETLHLTSFVSLNPKLGYMAWEYLRKHWDQISHRMSQQQVETVLTKATEWFTHDHQIEEIKGFAAKYPSRGTTKAATNALEYIEANRAWLARNEGPICDALSRMLGRRGGSSSNSGSGGGGEGEGDDSGSFRPNARDGALTGMNATRITSGNHSGDGNNSTGNGSGNSSLDDGSGGKCKCHVLKCAASHEANKCAGYVPCDCPEEEVISPGSEVKKIFDEVPNWRQELVEDLAHPADAPFCLFGACEGEGEEGQDEGGEEGATEEEGEEESVGGEEGGEEDSEESSVAEEGEEEVKAGEAAPASS